MITNLYSLKDPTIKKTLFKVTTDIEKLTDYQTRLEDISNSSKKELDVNKALDFHQSLTNYVFTIVKDRFISYISSFNELSETEKNRLIQIICSKLSDLLKKQIYFVCKSSSCSTCMNNVYTYFFPDKLFDIILVSLEEKDLTLVNHFLFLSYEEYQINGKIYKIGKNRFHRDSEHLQVNIFAKLQILIPEHLWVDDYHKDITLFYNLESCGLINIINLI